ncbi:MAG TPA: sigma-70 family RNA polymerase sigma factor [Bryobacteraceae bacterium]|nr:sigma-70 family RNA polymerase sigma factor [Bryobacteraceae bacterium]
MSQRQDEFERVALPHLRSLLRFARRLSVNMPAAEDLVQEAYLKAWRGFGQFESGTNIRAWLFRVILNVHRAQGRKTGPAIFPLRADPAADLDEHRLEILQALDRLPEDHRAVLMLGAVEGFTCREIAEILSLPIGTVMSRLSRARQSMRTLLLPHSEKVSR